MQPFNISVLLGQLFPSPSLHLKSSIFALNPTWVRSIEVKCNKLRNRLWVTLPTVQHSSSTFWRPSTEILRPSIIHKQWSEAFFFLFLWTQLLVCFLSQWQQWVKIALTETHPEESQIKHHYSLGKYCEEISSPLATEEMRSEALFLVCSGQL